jgi:3-hydroxyisobutyrate dehydrogenase
MAKLLVQRGYDVVGFDVSETARTHATELGVPVVGQLDQAVRDRDVVVLMLPDSNVVEAVLTSDDLSDALCEDSVVVDMSSSEPSRTRKMSALLAERGVRMIDAPVSGGVKGALNASLTVMVGGDEATVEERRGFLEVFGKVVYVGAIGSGHAVKALNNLLSATHLLVTSEAMLVGERFGLSPEVMLAVFNSSSGRSGSTENKWPNFILPETFNSGFGLRLMLKDMKIAVKLAEELDVPSELGSEAVTLWSRAADDLAPTADHTEIARWIFDEYPTPHP